MFSEPTQGKIIRNFNLGDYEFTEAVFRPNEKLSTHAHDFAYFRFIFAGDFTEYFRNDGTLFSPSTMMFRSSGETHSNHFYTKTQSLTVKLRYRYFEKISQQQKIEDTVILAREGITRLFLRLYKELDSIDEYSKITFEGLMLEIIAETLRQYTGLRSSGNLPLWLLRTKESLDEEFIQDVTIKSLAKAAGVHPTHLVTEFRKYFNITIGDYIRHRRIDFAQKQLITSNVPISDIALASGFYDQSHLTQVFKKITGMTPAVYRTTFRNH